VSRDHILVHDRDMSVHCTRCGQKLRLELPVSVDVWLVAAAKFGELHTDCAPQEQP
jgi:hypothetical protein